MTSPFASWKNVVFTLVLAIAFYLLAYSFLSRRQSSRGPWEATFGTNEVGAPHLIVDQPTLGISNVIVRFADERLAPTNRTGRVAFSEPKRATPFGYVQYDDLMFQPGVVTLDCFGHLVEMTPKKLGLNGMALEWTNQAVHVLTATNKMPAEARQRLKGGYKR
jgi:hypothetical protein